MKPLGKPYRFSGNALFAVLMIAALLCVVASVSNLIGVL